MRPYTYYVLSHDPPILCYLAAGKTEHGIPPLPEALRPVTLLEYPLSLQNEPEQLEDLPGLQDRLRDQGIEHHFMVNEPIELTWLTERGIRGAHFSQNAFVNEHVFAPTQQQKLYDAIHIAGMHDVKRHELARDIERLYVVTYYGKDLHAYRPELSHAEFNRTYLDHPRVAALINASVTGLCLSASEGAMFASMEYLMCGVPVVTTPSRGGRAEFFDTTNSITVDPDPAAVRRGVDRWKREPPDPDTVRSDVLRQVHGVRMAFCRYVAGLMNRGNSSETTAPELMLRFFSDEGIAARALPFKWLSEPGDIHQFRYDLDSAVPSRVPGFTEQARQESLLLRSPTSKEMTLDRAGSIIWGLCDGDNSVRDIAGMICAAYDVDATEVKCHVRSTLRLMHLHDLIH